MARQEVSIVLDGEIIGTIDVTFMYHNTNEEIAIAAVEALDECEVWVNGEQFTVSEIREDYL